MYYRNVRVPEVGSQIQICEGNLSVPDCPIIPYIEGDGIGPEIWVVARRVLEVAIQKAYQGRRKMSWMEVYAGGKAHQLFGNWLPEETIQAFREFLVGIKGPLTTPVGGGIRSLNVALRGDLDLYACLRPVRWFPGVPTPVKHPERVDMVIFRENTEDLYVGIELEAGTEDNARFRQALREQFPEDYSHIRFPETSGIGIKPVSREGTYRLVRSAIRWALENHRRSVTLVHKGNIMKYTEGAFLKWGYEVAESEFGERVYTLRQWEATAARHGDDFADLEEDLAIRNGKLIVKDLVADSMFEQTVVEAEDFDVIATLNLTGDYLSDALVAQVGGVGIAPGGNINFETGIAVFEATHGTAPQFAGKGVVNPSSVILSGEMLLRYLGWNEAADLVIRGIEGAVAAKTVTFDFHREMKGAKLVGTAEFGEEIIRHME
ncbi:MAG TPA: NADP-dependent isocitrate dehydrogenase [Anaerolineaceae bacterium]|nr:NADP-dependent isocitrate dehydrogenase [Anaerolineaceae bacterium]